MTASTLPSLERKSPGWRETRRLIGTDLDRVAQHLQMPDSWAHRAYFFCLPGFQALLFHRVSRCLYVKGWTGMARMVSLFALYLTRAEIPPTTSIGPSALIAHATCVNVFGKLGARITINGCSAIGGGMAMDDIGGGPGYPVIGDDVVLAYGANVLGPVCIGNGAHIGPGALVTFDVPEGGLVLWDRPRVIRDGANRA
ncbi:hypothetical protein [Variovorax sp. dw_954]|uniref:serine O-acetyltransferase n=1 Tax=Variovorax sp. dw_954 TaxID=2720078 RepID=UPI001BD39F1E|nr:hypothetical protein [Variovorax sp. dw_954]